MSRYTRYNVLLFALVAALVIIVVITNMPKGLKSDVLPRSDTNLGIARVSESLPVEKIPSNARSAVPSQLHLDNNQDIARGTVPGEALRYKEQRNELSKILNSVKQELAIMSCDMIKLKQRLQEPTSIVSATGGWCESTSRNNSGSHRFDQPLAIALENFLTGKSVASFGDGPGDYKRYLDSTHRLTVYDAYDGAPYGPKTSGGAVKFLDLTAPQYGLPLYDWVVSLEVAEHIPSQFESVYIDNIVRHAGEGIILSWAVPGQGGLSHVNNRPLSYVQNLLKSKGFEHDENASLSLRQKAVLPWMRNNVNVYRRMQDSKAGPDNA